MGPAASSRPTFALTPVGPNVRAGAAIPAAAGGGRLVGELTGGAVRTWFESDNGRVLVMWPRGFRARWDPLELLDATGRVVARGGEQVTVQGGYLKASDPATGRAGEPVFAAGAIVEPG